MASSPSSVSWLELVGRYTRQIMNDVNKIERQYPFFAASLDLYLYFFSSEYAREAAETAVTPHAVVIDRSYVFDDVYVYGTKGWGEEEHDADITVIEIVGNLRAASESVLTRNELRRQLRALKDYKTPFIAVQDI